MNPMFSESAAFALQRLTDLGWSPVAAQGMVGNLIQESGRNLNPTALHDGGTGFGIAGFRDPRPGEGRWTNLRRFSRERGLDHRTLDAQLQFIDHELRTSERGVGNRLKQARDPAEAARVAIDFFRPAGWTSRNPTGGHGWKNRLQNTMTLAGAPMPTNRIAMDQVQQASAAPPMLSPPRPGGLGGLGGTEPPAAYASMSDMPASGAHAAQGGDPNQTVPMALAALNAGDDRAPRADAFGQTIPSLRQAGVDPRQPFTGRASGLDSFGPGGPQPFAASHGPAAIGPRGGGVAAMQANPMQAPAPNMTPRPDAPPSFMREPQSQAQGVPSFVQGAPPPIQYGGPSMVPDTMPARPSTPNVNAIAGMPSPQQQPPMPAPQPNTGGQPMPRGIDPNQYAGGEWIPPEIGRQLAAQQMSGQANMPAQGAMPAQGGGGGMPAPQGAPGGLGGLGGLRGPLHAMFLSMLSATDRRAPFANMPAFMQQQMQMEQQMQAQRQAGMERQQVLNARRAALRQAGMPDDLIDQVVFDENATRMALEHYQHQQADERFREFERDLRPGAPSEGPGTATRPAQPGQARQAPASQGPGASRGGQPLQPGTPEADAAIADFDQRIAAEQDLIERARRRYESIANQSDNRTKAVLENTIAEAERRIADLAEQRNQLIPQELGFSEAQQIYKDFESETEMHSEAFLRFDQMAQIVTRATGTADRELIRVLDRMFDPRLRRPVSGDDDIRGTSALDRGLNYIEMLKEGTQLTPDLRREIMAAARDYLGAYVEDYQNIADTTRERVNYFFPNADPDRAVLGRRHAQFERVMRTLESIPPDVDPEATPDQSGIINQARSFFRSAFGISDAEIDRIPRDAIQAERLRRQQER